MELFLEHPGLNLSIDSTSGMHWTLVPCDTAKVSYFTSQELRPHALIPQPIHRLQPDWVTGLLVFSLILIAWTRFFYPSRFRQVCMSPISKRFLNQLTREGNLFTERMTLALSMVFLIGVSLLMFEANILLGTQKPFGNWPTIIIYFIFLAVLLLYWIGKIFLVRTLGFIFKTRETTHDYLLNILIFNIITGLILFPFLPFIIYLKSIPLLYLSFFLLGLMFLFRFLKGFMIGISLRKFSYLFLFVYLCALEILPLVVLAKVFLSYYS
ncbi:MAG: DUF4271 domain-containing protein [Bacteroidota bacterium]|nr:DUF4271 domain-containing protein [Bacteroidota bacterium]